MNLLDLALILAENLRVLILVPLLAGLVAIGVGFFMAPTFTATSKILLPLQQNASAILAAQLGGSTGLERTAAVAAGINDPSHIALLRSGPVLGTMTAAQYIALLKSAPVLDAIIQRFNPDALSQTESVAGLRQSLAGRTQISTKDGIISIEVNDEDPQHAAGLANAYPEALRALIKTLATSELVQRRLFLETQLKQTKENLNKSEAALRVSGRGTAKVRGGGPEDPAKLRAFEHDRMLFDLLSKQYELARIDEAREGTVIQVLEAALPPEKKSGPKKAINALIATVIVFFLMIIFVFMRHGMRNMANSNESAAKVRRLRQLIRPRRELS